MEGGNLKSVSFRHIKCIFNILFGRAMKHANSVVNNCRAGVSGRLAAVNIFTRGDVNLGGLGDKMLTECRNVAGNLNQRSRRNLTSCRFARND